MIQFCKLQEEHLEKVMGWRVKPEISSNMITDVEYDMKKQHRWFNSIIKDDTCRYWVVSYRNILIGLINLAVIDGKNFRCSAGYYIGELEYRQLGAEITPYLYNYVFKEMKFRKIYGEVMWGNESILTIHKLHGFRDVGIYKDHIFKNGNYFDVVLIELLSDVWLKLKKYQSYIAEFD